MLQISFRLRLTLWYTAIVAVPLLVIGVVTYVAVQQELNDNLDSSLQRVAESLDYIIRKKQEETREPLRPSISERPRKVKQAASSVNTNSANGNPTQLDSSERASLQKAAQQRASRRKRAQNAGRANASNDYFAFFRAEERKRFVGPMPPPKDTAPQVEEKADVVWSAVYEHILLNPKNYFIQVADSSGVIVWRSENLLQQKIRQLPLPATGMLVGDTFPFRYTIPKLTLGKQRLRMFVYHTGTVQVSVGYPVDEIETTLGKLFSSLIFALPFILLLAVGSGWFLAKYFVQPVQVMTQLAEEITEHNLSQRLPERRVNDEITQLARTLNAMIERLERSFKQIRQFTGDASHELRTPLAILMGELEVALHSDKTPEEYQEILSSALEEVSRLSQVVKNLLELSRADSGQVALDVKVMNVSALLEDIVEDAMMLGEEKNIRVESSVERDVVIFGDKVRLHQAFLNIIDNAIKYTPHGGLVTVSLRKQDESALVSVADTGLGIPESDQDLIFDRLFRVDKSRSGELGGHGLGLSIVKWVVEAHKGKIKVTSQLGKGSIFFIWLPLDASVLESGQG
ncbi:MAG: HAMP domain-containing protein [Candidatus Kapaibacterium sp.]|nr:MAG: HAMP domain-containing protein [Candidatus Kapabacteria bacterium]